MFRSGFDELLVLSQDDVAGYVLAFLGVGGGVGCGSQHGEGHLESWSPLEVKKSLIQVSFIEADSLRFAAFIIYI